MKAWHTTVWTCPGQGDRSCANTSIRFRAQKISLDDRSKFHKLAPRRRAPLLTSPRMPSNRTTCKLPKTTMRTCNINSKFSHWQLSTNPDLAILQEMTFGLYNPKLAIHKSLKQTPPPPPYAATPEVKPTRATWHDDQGTFTSWKQLRHWTFCKSPHLHSG